MLRFSDFAQAHGVIVGEAYASDRIQRCPTEAHPRKKNGAYFWDGRRGWVQAWDGDGQVHWYNDPDAKPWSDAEKLEMRRRSAAQQQDRAERNRQAAQRAQEFIRTATPGTHGYLQFKGLPQAHGLVLPDESLIVPMRHVKTGDLVGAQTIRWLPNERTWEKKMLPGMAAKGAVFRMGPTRAAEAILCEGYATGLSIDAAVRQMRIPAAVVVCFSDSNLAHVAPQIGGRRYVFADNDKSGAGERAALATGLPYCMSDEAGEDANDLHARAGLLAVCKKIMGVRRC